MPEDKKESKVLYAKVDGDIVVIKIVGRGNFNLSPRLKMVVDKFTDGNASPRFLIDLEECPTLDSTFMGVMAAVGMKQKRETDQRLKVLHSNRTTESQMEKLGLRHILDIRPSGNGVHVGDEDFKAAERGKQSRLDQMVHMIESHQALIDAHSGNELEFRNVLDNLTAGVEAEKKNRN
ncbi:MAG: STAS domain-containing protein [Candidatus Sumerlaeia bacterium]